MRDRSVAVVFGTRPEAVKLAPVAVGARCPRPGRSTPASTTTRRWPPTSSPSSASTSRTSSSTSVARHAAGQLARGDDAARSRVRRERPDVVVVQGDTNTTLAGALAANAHADPAGARRGRAAQLRPGDARGAQPRRRRPSRRPVLRADRDEPGAARGRGDHGRARDRHGEHRRRRGAARMLPGRDRTDKAARTARPRRATASCSRPSTGPRTSTTTRVLRRILSELAALPLPVLLPLHPRSAARAEAAGLLDLPGSVRIVEPLGYREFLGLARESAFLVSDSGGVQEEASIVKRPVLVVRVSTERPEVLGTFAELVAPGPADRRARSAPGPATSTQCTHGSRPRRLRTVTVTRASASPRRSPHWSDPTDVRPDRGVASPRIGIAPARLPDSSVDGTASPALNARLPAPDRCGSSRRAAASAAPAKPNRSGVGEDFEYRTSPDSFLTVRCEHCGVVYLDPRPVRAELTHDLPGPLPRVHVHRGPLRLRLPRAPPARGPPAPRGRRDAPARRRGSSTSGAATGSTSTCSREFGEPGWQLEGVDLDPRAADAAEARGPGRAPRLDRGARPRSRPLRLRDPDPDDRARRRPRRRAARDPPRAAAGWAACSSSPTTPDRSTSRSPSAGTGAATTSPATGTCSTRPSLRRLATHTGFLVDELDTMVSPVNWVYSLRNALDDWAAPRPVVDWLSLESPIPLAAFTAFDWLHQRVGRGRAPPRGAAPRRRAHALSTPYPEITDAPVVVVGGGIAGCRRDARAAAQRARRRAVRGRAARSAAWRTRIATRTASRTTPARTSSPTGSRPRPASLDQCRDVERYGETVWLDGRSYDYPTGLLRVPRFLRSALRGADRRRLDAACHRRGLVPPRVRRRARGRDRRCRSSRHGPGAPASELSPAVADKIPGSIADTSASTLAARLTHRAVAIGYCREAPQSANVWHVYPERGVATVCERLAADVADSVRLQSPVECINVSDGRARSASAWPGRDVPAAAVISTAPINVLPRIVEGTDALEPFRAVPLPSDGLREPAPPRP